MECGFSLFNVNIAYSVLFAKVYENHPSQPAANSSPNNSLIP